MHEGLRDKLNWFHWGSCLYLYLEENYHYWHFHPQNHPNSDNNPDRFPKNILIFDGDLWWIYWWVKARNGGGVAGVK